MGYKKHASIKEVANLPASATLAQKVELSLCGRTFTQSHFEWNPPDSYLISLWHTRDWKNLLWLASLAEEHKQRQSQLPEDYRRWIEDGCPPDQSALPEKRFPRILTAAQEAVLDKLYPTAPDQFTIDPEMVEQVRLAKLRKFLRSLAGILLEQCLLGKHPDLAAGLLFSREPIAVRETSMPWLEQCMTGEAFNKVCRGELTRKSRLSSFIEAFELMTAPGLVTQHRLRKRIFQLVGTVPNNQRMRELADAIGIPYKRRSVAKEIPGCAR